MRQRRGAGSSDSAQPRRSAAASEDRARRDALPHLRQRVGSCPTPSTIDIAPSSSSQDSAGSVSASCSACAGVVSIWSTNGSKSSRPWWTSRRPSTSDLPRRRQACDLSRPVVCLRCPHRVGRSVGTSARRACLPFSRRSTDTTVSVPEQGLGSGRSTRRSRAVAHSRSPPHRRVAVDRQWCQPQASRHAGRPHLGVGRSRSLRTSLPTARSGSSICDGEPEQASIADLALRPATLGAIDRGPRVTVTAPRSSLCATCGSG